jgi:hypothetical protein
MRKHTTHSLKSTRSWQTMDSELPESIRMALEATVEAMRLDDPLFNPDDFDFTVEIVKADSAELGTPLIEWADGSKIWKE